MNVSLTPELEQFIHAQVETGLYNNASEVVREAIRALKRNDAEWRAYVHQAIEEGVAQIARGEFVTSEELDARRDARRKAWLQRLDE